MMENWQDHLSGLDVFDDLEQLPDSASTSEIADDESEEESPNLLAGIDSSKIAPEELPELERALGKYQSGDFSSVSAGDIVYVSQQAGERLLYTKAVYLGRSKSGKCTARDWNTKYDAEVSHLQMLRKGNVTRQEKMEAASITLLRVATLDIDSVAELEESYPSPPAEAYSDEDTPSELPGVVDTLDEPQELEFPNIAPGDIVYIRRQTGEQLTYNKAVYLGDPGGGQHIARNWDTKNDLKVSISELVRKENVTEDERVEAESIKAYVAIQDSETLSKSRFYLKHATLPPEIKSPFITRMNKLATGDEWLSGYDREMVQKACSAFLKFENQIMGRSVRVEELVRMFYASAVTAAPNPKKKGSSSDNARQAGIKRHAALLTDVLIGVVDEASEQVFPERDIVSAQLREEYAGMLSRANSAVKDDVGSTHRDQLKEAELSPQLLEALKSRLSIVIEGEETAVTLPKFGAHLMKQTCSSFLFRLQSTYPADRAILLETILGEFLACAETEIRHDRAGSNKEGRTVAAERLVALFLSLLISIDAALELERLAGVPPRIRNQFTAVLMEERFRYLSQASEIEERLFRVSQRSKPEFDIHFFTENSRRAHDKRYGEMIANDNSDTGDLDDPSQPKYCYCLRGSHGIMVACDGPNCRRKWFHLSCTDLKKPLNDYKTWFCVFCQPPMKAATEDTQEASATATVDAGDAESEPKEAQESETTANERPPRGMVCNNCKFVWQSASALELRDCPSCGSYSVFAESPPRTTSPETTVAILRPDATGEAAMGQYFSERTDKFMSLYRRETMAEESKSEVPRESFPDPWSHLHTSSSANSPRREESPPALAKASLPDTSNPDNTTGDGSTLVINPDLQRVRRTIMYLIHTAHRLNEVFQLIPGGGTSSRSGAGDSYVKEVYDQLCSVAKTLNDLLQWQDDDPQGEGLRPEWALKLQIFQSNLSTLCSSITITVEDMGNALGSGETKRWEEMAHKMENDEGVDCLNRFRLYLDFIVVLTSLTEEPTGRNLLPVKLHLEEKISTLLGLQESYVLRVGQAEEAAATTAEGPAIESPYIGASDNPTRDASTPMDDSDSTKVRQLRQTLDQIDYAEVVLYDAIHRDSNGNFTDVKEIKDLYDELHNFDNSLRKLLHHQRRDTECRTKLISSGGVVSTLCSSVQNTLEDILIAMDSNDPMQWADTVHIMEDSELVGWRQRFKLYQDVLTNLTGTRGRDSDSEYWLKQLDADVLELLGSQESNISQAATRSSHRSVIWPSRPKHPQVEDMQTEGGLDGPLNDLEEEDDGQINCICGFNEDDGNTIACDTCNKWSHTICYYPQYGDSLPEDLDHWCIDCRPERPVDAQAAHIRQQKNVKPQDLEKFAENFRRKSRVPDDLVPILAKDQGSVTSSTTMASPGLDRLPSIRHNRTDPARDYPRDLPIRDFVKQAEAEATRGQPSHEESAVTPAESADRQPIRQNRPDLGTSRLPSIRDPEPAVRFRPNGTAVYNLPSSLLNMPRAPMNERLNTLPAERKVSFEDDAPEHPEFSNITGAREPAMSSPAMASPTLHRLPSIRHNRTNSARDVRYDLPIRDFVRPDAEDKEYAARKFSRETLRRQQAEAEATRRRQKDLEAAENRQLDLEAERARNRRQMPTMFDGFVDDESSSWSRRTGPPAPPGTRSNSASRLPASSRSSLRRSGSYGRATVYQYHYPDSPLVIKSDDIERRPSELIRDRGREVIERERARAAAEELQRAFEEGAGEGVGAGSRRWEPVFDEVEERVSGREYYYVSEGPAREEARRRRGSWSEERKKDFWGDLDVSSRFGAETETTLRREEDLEAAGNRQVDLEAERARNRRHAHQKEPAVISEGSATGGVPFPAAQNSRASSSSSPKPPAHPSLEKIASLRGILHRFEREVSAFEHTPPTKPSESHAEGKRLSGSIMAQVLFKLDAIDKTEDDPETGEKRREVFKEAQDLLTRVGEAVVHHVSSVT
jgi:hypothetical protein